MGHISSSILQLSQSYHNRLTLIISLIIAEKNALIALSNATYHAVFREENFA